MYVHTSIMKMDKNPNPGGKRRCHKMSKKPREIGFQKHNCWVWMVLVVLGGFWVFVRGT